MVDVWLRGGREEGEVGEHCWCLTGILDGGITRRLCKGEECGGGVSRWMMSSSRKRLGRIGNNIRNTMDGSTLSTVTSNNFQASSSYYTLPHRGMHGVGS